MFGNAFPHAERLDVDNLYQCFEGAWELACNAHVYIAQKIKNSFENHLRRVVACSQTGESELSITKLSCLLSTTKVVFFWKRKTTLVVNDFSHHLSSIT